MQEDTRQSVQAHAGNSYEACWLKNCVEIYQLVYVYMSAVENNLLGAVKLNKIRVKFQELLGES